MKRIYHTVKACVLYFVFAFFATLFVKAAFDRGEQFHFRNGAPLSEGQRAIVVFVLFLLAVISGYAALKRAQLDWKLWKRRQRKHSSKAK